MDVEVDHQAKPNIDLSHDPVSANEESVKPMEETQADDDTTHITDAKPHVDEETVEINEDLAAGDSLKHRKKSMNRSNSQPSDNLLDKDECQDDEGDNNELSTEMDTAKEELKGDEAENTEAPQKVGKPMNIIRQGLSFLLLLVGLVLFNQVLLKVLFHFFGSSDDKGKGKSGSSVHGSSKQDQEFQETEFSEFA